jgi:hypothetical protein
MEGLSEACDAWILPTAADADAAALLPRLAAATLPGLRFLSARWLDADEPELSKCCQGATYAAPLPADEVRQRAAALLARTTWEVSRKGKRRGERRAAPRDVDLRASLLELSVDDGSEPREGPCRGDAGRAMIRFALAQRPEGTLRPREVLEALLGDDALPKLWRDGHFSLAGGVKSPLTP